jgi:hypothetical protein
MTPSQIHARMPALPAVASVAALAYETVK